MNALICAESRASPTAGRNLSPVKLRGLVCLHTSGQVHALPELHRPAAHLASSWDGCCVSDEPTGIPADTEQVTGPAIDLTASDLENCSTAHLAVFDFSRAALAEDFSSGWTVAVTSGLMFSSCVT